MGNPFLFPLRSISDQPWPPCRTPLANQSVLSALRNGIQGGQGWMNVERLVLLWNETLRSCGSGCWVTERLILTARHVVLGPEEGDDTPRTLEVLTREQVRAGG